ncbi:MAG: alpha-L-fucosidase [Burkholderiales bacterium]|nr:alpha-L-fucosidase [Phycisphaerae bacterium]
MLLSKRFQRHASGVAALLSLACVAVVAPFAVAQSGPGATVEQVADAIARTPAIPADATVQPDWKSIQANYATPQWFYDGKFGIMMHWGVYSAPAKHNEWDLKYMYGANAGIRKWYIENFGPLNEFGYLDFMDPTKGPKPGSAAAAYYKPFTASKWDPDAWASLFKATGARIVTISAEHHDGFALWDSQVTPFNTKQMGPKRDLVGDLATAVRKQGMKYGIQDHGIENYTFMSQFKMPERENTDVDRPDRKPYYLPGENTQNGDPVAAFLDNWYRRQVEMIDKYQPELLWYDNGINDRKLDPLKTKLAAYYYNKALEWKKQVTITGKGANGNEAFLQGAMHDHEKIGRAPKSIQQTPWMVHDTMTKGTSWAFNKIDQPGLNGDASRHIRMLAHIASLNGVLLLNIGPEADGTIPQEQQDVLKDIGAWMAINGEAIYDTRPWKQNSEGSNSSGASASTSFRFLAKAPTLYAVMMGWPTEGAAATIESLGADDLPGSTITGIELLGHGPVTFTREPGKLTINLPAQPAGVKHAFAFKISGNGLVP